MRQPKEFKQCPLCMAIKAMHRAMNQSPPNLGECPNCKGRGFVEAKPIIPRSQGLKDKPGPDWAHWDDSEWEALITDIDAALGRL